MNKTVSLKLNSKEEEIICSMRKKGISPSAIIREAFWKYVKEIEMNKNKKSYKEVNPEKQYLKEKLKIDNEKVYKMVNQIDRKVNLNDDFLREKLVYQPVNQVHQSQIGFLDQYIYQLQRHVQQLDDELLDWKTRYATEIQYWKEAYQSLQIEYQNHVTDSTKRIDDRFNQIMFYIEELKKSPLDTFEIPSQSENQKQIQKKRWTSQNVRM
jgi:hypothetical protein